MSRGLQLHLVKTYVKKDREKNILCQIEMTGYQSPETPAEFIFGRGSIPAARKGDEKSAACPRWGMITPYFRKGMNQVPISQEDRYFSCSGVRMSISTAKDFNFRRAISLSIFFGTG